LTFSFFKRIIYRKQNNDQFENDLPEKDEKLIADCKRGDVHAFKKLMRKHQSYAFALAFRALGDENDANDIVQECFIRIWRSIGTFDLNRKFTTWMYRIVSNLCVDWLRQRKRYAVSFSHIETNPGLINRLEIVNVEDELSQKELGNWINILAEQLTPKQRMVFVMRDLQGMSIAEIGETLQMRTNTVKSNLHLARRSVRQRLLEIDPELENGY
jgi:RNA polymerase sigma-70 factor (ECF subfamily)